MGIRQGVLLHLEKPASGGCVSVYMVLVDVAFHLAQQGLANLEGRLVKDGKVDVHIVVFQKFPDGLPGHF